MLFGPVRLVVRLVSLVVTGAIVYVIVCGVQVVEASRLSAAPSAVHPASAIVVLGQPVAKADRADLISRLGQAALLYRHHRSSRVIVTWSPPPAGSVGSIAYEKKFLVDDRGPTARPDVRCCARRLDCPVEDREAPRQGDQCHRGHGRDRRSVDPEVPAQETGCQSQYLLLRVQRSSCSPNSDRSFARRPELPSVAFSASDESRGPPIKAESDRGFPADLRPPVDASRGRSALRHLLLRSPDAHSGVV